MKVGHIVFLAVAATAVVSFAAYEEVPVEEPSPQEEIAVAEVRVIPVEDEVVLYDVPLYECLQRHIIQLCQTYEVDPAIVFALIRYESNYDPHAVGDGGDSIGLMQIQPRWHSERMEQLGCTDLYDPYQNVTVGISILAEKLAQYDSVGEALTAYNAGDYGAYVHYFGKGIYANAYAEKILAYAEELRK